LDDNRLVPGRDYQIDLQRGKSPYHQGDMAPNNLFTFVDPKVFQIKTFKLFFDLLDNYERGVCINLFADFYCKTLNICGILLDRLVLQKMSLKTN